VTAPAGAAAGATDPVLAVEGLDVRFATRRGTAHVVNGVSWSVGAGETLAIVGESGSGKSVSVMALLGLVPRPPATVTGSARFAGQDLVDLPEEALRKVRGPGIGMVFQDPMTSLNPVLTIGRQLTEHMEVHLGLSPAKAEDRAAELLALVGIPDPRARLSGYPHQMSGGMRQRVMIAIALACDPAVLVADEATTALDVTIQAQIVELIADLQRELGMAVVWITHDLGVVAGIADRVAVMYAGRIVEEAAVDDLYADPRHPYTQGLLASLPVLGGPSSMGAGRRDLPAIGGLPPDPTALPAGCAFRPRCPFRGDERCAHEVPPLRPAGTGGAGSAAGAGGHRVATFYDAPPAPARRSPEGTPVDDPPPAAPASPSGSPAASSPEGGA
jgi:peptide/nickel transport system ATP-binding protein